MTPEADAKPAPPKPNFPPADGPTVVTGGCGFIGSHLVEALLAQGRQVVIVDDLDAFYPREIKLANLQACRASTGEDDRALSHVELSLTSDRDLLDLFERERPASVFHLAARAGVRPSIEDPVGYAQANVVGTVSVLKAAERTGVPRLVVASSSSVYGAACKTPFAETDDVSRPVSPYAATKLATEVVCHATHALTRTPIACLRFFTVYGPRQRPDLAIHKFMRKIAAGEAIPVFGDGSTSRDYTYVGDVVAGTLAAERAIEAHGYRVWNLGSDGPVTLSELIATIETVVGKSAVIDRQPEQPGDVPRTWADLTRARDELGYSPSTSLRDGLAKQWAWMRAHGA